MVKVGVQGEFHLKDTMPLALLAVTAKMFICCLFVFGFCFLHRECADKLSKTATGSN